MKHAFYLLSGQYCRILNRNGTAGYLILLIAGLAMASSCKESLVRYEATWESLEQVDPVPEWFMDAKFGIYFHWGVYSVPAFGNEWYPRNMYITDRAEHLHHIENYGTPEEWPYHYFITGAEDRHGNFVQFAPRLTSEGGKFDPEEWADLFAAAGAKFAGPVAEHHDGFSMWASDINPWNAKDMGPRLDLVGLLTDAIRERGMKVLVSMHQAFNITDGTTRWFYQYVPDTEDPMEQILYAQLPRERNEEIWLEKHKEVIDNYKPDFIWQDFNLKMLSDSVLLQFFAYYHNKAIEWNREVVVTYKAAFDTLKHVIAVRDYERGGPPDITDFYWLTDDAVSRSSWCYTEGIEYYSAKQVLHSLFDRISKNGNLLLNLSPMADGTIPGGQKEILLTMGDWLGKYGEAVYNTRAWIIHGEGPTKMGRVVEFDQPQEGTSSDIRFTRSKDNSTLYAIALGWPEESDTLTIMTLSGENFSVDDLVDVSLLGPQEGVYIPLEYFQDDTALHILLPEKPAEELAYAFRLTFANSAPGL